MGKKMDIEIRDKEIDVKKIMKKIRDNIRRRREERGEVDVEDLEREAYAGDSSYNTQSDIDSINANWNIENKTYRINSHRKILGPFFITGRKLVHEEVRRYVDPIFWKQNEFNARTVRILNHLSKELQKLKRQVRIISRTSKGKKK